MLKELRIKNFILIEDLRLEFDKGLDVLTGETGAGKSIVLDALGLLLGERFASESVRQTAPRSEIDAVFGAPKTHEFRRWWEEHGFEASEDIVIRREGFPDGRSRAFLNDRPVTLGALEELGTFLVDVHGQNEHQNILRPSVQLASLDRFAGLEESCARLAPLYDAWRSLADALQAKQLSEQERMQRIDVYRFQLDEIDRAHLRVGEDAELSAKLPELKNAERLRDLSQIAYSALYEEEGSAVERITRAHKACESLAKISPVAQSLAEELDQTRIRLQEASQTLQQWGERWSSDPELIEQTLSRMELISRLQKKYGGTLESVLQHAETLRAELDQLENVETNRKKLEAQCEQARQTLDQASSALSARRKKAAKELAAAVQKQLADLGLKQAVFRCSVEQIGISSPALGGEGVGEGAHRYSSSGIDRVTFEWSPNPGEGIRPLKDIASGGEMSRVMLALKTVLAQEDTVPTLVFDEIDAGIGGVTAQAVGKKLRALSRHHQILCVSHLPQIAACAHVHFQVAKRVERSRTSASVVRLESDARLEELARMLGSQVTPTSVQHARELLAQNQ